MTELVLTNEVKNLFPIPEQPVEVKVDIKGLKKNAASAPTPSSTATPTPAQQEINSSDPRPDDGTPEEAKEETKEISKS